MFLIKHYTSLLCLSALDIIHFIRKCLSLPSFWSFVTGCLESLMLSQDRGINILVVTTSICVV